MLIVQKYGGSSVADAEKVLNVAKRIANVYRGGNDVVVVVSAQGNTTNDLIGKAQEICADCSKRELDMLLSTGEQQSIALVAMALNSLGLPAVSLNAQQAGIFSDSRYGDAKILGVSSDRIMKELEKRNIVVTAGFQGIDEYGEVTTLGRGASDTTAIALAASLNADSCEIYTDVDGVFTADPRIIVSAKRHKEISYDEMLEMASMGAKVLHNRSVELAKKFKLAVTVKSSFNSGEGTLVTCGSSLESKFVRGITADRKTFIAALKIKRKKALAELMLKMFEADIAPDIITVTDGNADLSVNMSFNASSFRQVRSFFDSKQAENTITEVSLSEGVSKISVIGTGIAYDTETAAVVYEALKEIGAEILLSSSSESKLSLILKESIVENALNTIHDKLDKAGKLCKKSFNRISDIV